MKIEIEQHGASREVVIYNSEGSMITRRPYTKTGLSHAAWDAAVSMIPTGASAPTIAASLDEGRREFIRAMKEKRVVKKVAPSKAETEGDGSPPSTDQQ